MGAILWRERERRRAALLTSFSSRWLWPSPSSPQKQSAALKGRHSLGLCDVLCVCGLCACLLLLIPSSFLHSLSSPHITLWHNAVIEEALLGCCVCIPLTFGGSINVPPAYPWSFIGRISRLSLLLLILHTIPPS